LMAAFLEGSASDPSPYSPVSRLFWNEFYVDIESLAEFCECRAAQERFGSGQFQARLRTAKRSEWVDYPEQMALRREVLEILAEYFFRKSGNLEDAGTTVKTVKSSMRASTQLKWGVNGRGMADFQRFLRERQLAREYAQ